MHLNAAVVGHVFTVNKDTIYQFVIKEREESENRRRGSGSNSVSRQGESMPPCFLSESEWHNLPGSS